MANNKKRLGRGLDALFQTAEEEETVIDIKLDDIRKNPYQPRLDFKEEAMTELADSIREHGILQPIIVRQSVKGYDIVAGERRYRASRIAEKETIPAIIKDLNDENMMEIAIIENLQRENLNPLEEALGYRQLMDELDMTQDTVSGRLGKSRPYIANMLRLLNLPNVIKDLINDGKLSGAHGRTLLGIKDPLLQEEVAKKAVSEEMSVRALERHVKSLTEPEKAKKRVQEKPQFIQKHEAKLKERFGTAVEIKKARKKGSISLEFKNEEEFTRIIKMLEDK